jgi:hypothetical protein
MKRTLLFNSDPADGGDSKAGETPALPAGAPPPAAAAVAESDAEPADAAELVKLKRERDDALRAKSDAEAARKKLEMDLAQREDEVRRLTTPPPAPPKPKSERAPNTFFDEEANGAD